MNRFVGLGRLVRDPELKTIENSENKYVEMTIAINRDFKNKEGKVDADFINCVFWNGLAERVSKYIKKGDRLSFEGHIRVNSYEKDGTKKYTTRVDVDRIEFVEYKKDKQEPEYIGPETSTETHAESTESNIEDPFEQFGQSVALREEDLPF